MSNSLDNLTEDLIKLLMELHTNYVSYLSTNKQFTSAKGVTEKSTTMQSKATMKFDNCIYGQVLITRENYMTIKKDLSSAASLLLDYITQYHTFNSMRIALTDQKVSENTNDIINKHQYFRGRKELLEKGIIVPVRGCNELYWFDYTFGWMGDRRHYKDHGEGDGTWSPYFLNWMIKEIETLTPHIGEGERIELLETLQKLQREQREVG